MSHPHSDSKESNTHSRSIHDYFSNSVDNHITVDNDYIRKSAKRLQKALKNHGNKNGPDGKNPSSLSSAPSYTLMQCQDIISQALGFENFHTAKIYNKSVEFSKLAEKGIYAVNYQQDAQAQAQNLHLIGNLSNTHDRLYFNDKSLHEHALFLGDFNSGAFDAWFSRFEEAITPAKDGTVQPVIFYDTTGSYVVTQQIFAQARACGREEDVLVINYMTGGRDILEEFSDVKSLKGKVSHTMNLFSYGSSGSLTELLYSMLDDGYENAWKGRAIGLIATVMMALVYMRDNDNFVITIDNVREYLTFYNLDTLFKTRHDFPEHIKKAFREYCCNMPGFDEQAKIQDQRFMEQHGHLQMQITRVLGALSDSYGYIFNTNLGEVDYRDVIANNRILVVCCPALEKSTEEMKVLYQVHIASLKILIAEALGHTLENKRKQNGFVFFNRGLEFLPSGCAVLPAQMRSAGLIPVIYERKMPTSVEGQNFALNMLHRFYFKGEYPGFADAQRKLAANLKQGHCFYQPPMLIKDMEEMLLMQYNIKEFRLLDL